jgi:hypothetical protein
VHGLRHVVSSALPAQFVAAIQPFTEDQLSLLFA